MRLAALLLTVTLTTCHSYRILGIFATPSRSHHHLANGIVDALLKAGHEVVMVTPFPDKQPRKNLQQIDVSETIAIGEAIDLTRHPELAMTLVKEFSRNISSVVVGKAAVRDTIIRGNVDAVITEWFASDFDCGYAAVLRVPWIVLSSTVLFPHLEALVDDVRSIATIPIMMNNFPTPMNLFQRLQNTALYLMLAIGDWYDNISINAKVYEEQFAPLAAARGVPLPTFSEALANLSIMFSNTHPSIVQPYALPPNVIQIAGYHIPETTPPLPKDLQDLLDGSPQGVIYFSMGSIVKSSHLYDKTKKELIQLFGSLPYTVLWKFEKELDSLPKNVHIRPWMPQGSILAHPNMKVFITHGGLLSSLEALQQGVALLAVPVFGDQPTNAGRAVRAGYARQVPFSPDFAAPLAVELREILNNDSYSKRAKYLSKIFRKRPVAPSKLVPHYVELAIESNGAHHLRSRSFLYAWYERWMLDQLAIVLALLWLVYKGITTLFRRCLGRSAPKLKRK